jgi:hypothetical protein
VIISAYRIEKRSEDHPYIDASFVLLSNPAGTCGLLRQIAGSLPGGLACW